MFETIETPRLVLDKDRLAQNSQRFRALADKHNILLRPHLKTAKSVDVAAIALDGRKSAITVSTLKEAAYFAAEGYGDILYAVGITPNKFAHAKAIMDQYKGSLTLLTDNVAVTRAACAFAERERCVFSFLIELNSGENRGGILPESPDLLEIAQIFDACPAIDFKGVLTHGGHSYGTDSRAEIATIAEAERQAVTIAAKRLSALSIASPICSVGSTPTFLLGQSFAGVTEARAGVYMFFDLAQFSRKICQIEDIALSVLASVIGHARQGPAVIIDGGAFALSKDDSANRFLPDAGYGYVCDPVTMERLGRLSVNEVHQEHGTIHLEDEAWFERLPVGSMVRILPNHACATAANFDNYLVVEKGSIMGEWPRVNRW